MFGIHPFGAPYFAQGPLILVAVPDRTYGAFVIVEAASLAVGLSVMPVALSAGNIQVDTPSVATDIEVD